MRFGLRERVRGAKIVDVGASTGGFTDVLLRQGAARVTAVDVGHGQLLERLRRDRRVEVLEGADWKTLSLATAPGPFDFFSVDVSFVAARNMLRGLAFRLRPGAEGVVLVKPQFELPPRLVKGGQVTDPALRARALEAFAGKAAALGFVVVAHADSPVEGGQGTVEILTHLRFEGRPAALPQPGEKRPAVAAKRPPAAPRAEARAALDWFAVAAPGLEEVVRVEVAALEGVTAVRVVDGGVEFGGPLEVGMRANLWLRVATRVLLRLGAVEAREFAQLRHRARRLPWDRYLDGERPLRVEAVSSRSRLYHTGALAETVALAAADAVPGVKLAAGKGEDDAEDGAPPAARVLVRGQQDRFVISVDTSGELLHRRGWRLEAGRAPLRETLAAGILALAGHDPAAPFVDPMCGAGTIVLEAAARALGRAPGLGRAFAFEGWPAFEGAAWDRLRDQAHAAAKAVALPAPVHGYDRDERAVEIARRNAARAGLGDQVVIEQAELGAAAPPAGGPGLVVVNPPYGPRLAARTRGGREAPGIARALRATFPGWRAGLLVAAPAAPRALGLRVHGRHRLVNGGLRVELLVAELPGRAPAAKSQV